MVIQGMIIMMKLEVEEKEAWKQCRTSEATGQMGCGSKYHQWWDSEAGGERRGWLESGCRKWGYEVGSDGKVWPRLLIRDSHGLWSEIFRQEVKEVRDQNTEVQTLMDIQISKKRVTVRAERPAMSSGPQGLWMIIKCGHGQDPKSGDSREKEGRVWKRWCQEDQNDPTAPMDSILTCRRGRGRDIDRQHLRTCTKRHSHYPRYFFPLGKLLHSLFGKFLFFFFLKE